ncbi:hypothetical protein HF1_10740 [Mycoplasma haemofelis str. Langford 1]|uniref:Uncharacterized protein n=1 Tax=Mycoplasma haemofelis (strain Langford 1) TaxID=941640 RepID=E8ZIW1_MYCHL|nr:hypothetical protein [Mycoplasma haemofelis]CBY93082.1 hypothetical protein HF1_10740 [Mycoplasma haemofelis str. Langford 1]
MAYSLLKVATLGGTAAAAGGGIAAGASSMFGSQEELTEKPKIKNQQEETVDATAAKKESDPVPPKPSCIIWEARDLGGNSGSRQFSELLERHESKDAFFQKWGSSSERSMDPSFKAEIENACKNEGGKTNVNGRVYVWWGTVSNTQKWIYAGDMHKGDHDWETKIPKRSSSDTGASAPRA